MPTTNVPIRIAVIFLLIATAPFSASQTSRPSHGTTPRVSAEAADSQQLKRELAELRMQRSSTITPIRRSPTLLTTSVLDPVVLPRPPLRYSNVADEMRKLGLDVRLDEVKVPQWIRGPETAELVEYPGQASGTSQKIVLTALGGDAPTSADGITAEVVVVRSFDELNALGREKVAGKIVLFNAVFDKQKAANGMAAEAYGEAVAYRAGGARAAEDLGAVAALVRSVGNADYRLLHTGWSPPSGIPAGAVTSEDADFMARLAIQGKVRIHSKHLKDRAGGFELQRDRGSQGLRAPGTSGHCFRPPGFLGPRDWCDR